MEVIPVKDVTDIYGYGTIIIGSAVRVGSCLPEAINFVKNYRNQLNKVSTKIFSVHILNQGDESQSQKERQMYTASVRAIIAPEDEAFFFGKIDPSQLKFVERLLFKAVNFLDGNFRDWQAIQSWAQDPI